MKCIECGKAKMVHEVREVPYIYKGHSTSIPKVGGYFCGACDESLHSPEESEYLNSAMLAFNREVNLTLVDPSFITETRKKLKLDQREAAEIFGGGVNAFSRYETGKTKPPVSLIQLLTLLSNHPELLEELKPSRIDPKNNPQLARRKKASV